MGVHAVYLGCPPVVGDELYGDAVRDRRLRVRFYFVEKRMNFYIC